MKRIITICAALLMTASMFAQSPEKMSYQAVIRNASNILVINQTIGMQISILQGSANGTAVYVETQTPVTNANGLVSIEIGNGTVLSGTLSAINWANGPYFIKTETDPTGGTAYSITGTSQLLSVPYALHAKTAEAIAGAPANNFYLGQDTLGGIVFYIYLDQNGNQHGLIVSKTESSTMWQITGTTTGANRNWDGVYNTALMTGSPAKSWVQSLGAGWYLPSIVELFILWQSCYHTNVALSNAGATLLSSSAYWSSTERDMVNTFTCSFANGKTDYYNKTFSWNTRAIRAF